MNARLLEATMLKIGSGTLRRGRGHCATKVRTPDDLRGKHPSSHAGERRARDVELSYNEGVRVQAVC